MNIVQVNPRAILITLITITCVLATLNSLLAITDSNFNTDVTYYSPKDLFNMNSEVSVPTWYAQGILLFASTLFLINGFVDKARKKQWFGLTLVFLFLSVDEGASIHELLTVPLREALNISSGFLYYSWFLVYGALFAILAIVYFRFYVSFRFKIKLLLLLSTFLFLAGAVGFEAVGAFMASSSEGTNLGYSLTTITEETLELLGVSLLIYSLLVILSDNKQRIQVTF